MRTPTVIKLPHRGAYLWDNFRSEIEKRLAEMGSTDPLTDGEVLLMALDAGLLFVSRGAAAEVHATKNSDILGWLTMEVEHPPPPASMGVYIEETEARLAKLKSDYEAWTGAPRAEFSPDGSGVTIHNSGRILTGDEAEAQKASKAERIPIRPAPKKHKAGRGPGKAGSK